MVSVCHILSNWCASRDWKEALEIVIPRRKSDAELVAVKRDKKRKRMGRESSRDAVREGSVVYSTSDGDDDDGDDGDDSGDEGEGECCY